jgi:hypothetical protein
MPKQAAVNPETTQRLLYQLDLQNNSRDWKTQQGKFSSSRTKQAVIILGISRSHNIDRVAIGQAEL